MENAIQNRIAAVIVYFRTPDALAACLAGLYQQDREISQIVVVDNSSAVDGSSRPSIAGEWRWLPMASNVGFAAACNAGAAETDGDYLLVLNADLQLDAGACETMLSVMGDNPTAGIVGPRILDARGGVELSARAFPSVKTGLLGRSSWATSALRKFGTVPAQIAMALVDEPRSVDWVSGACMLVRRSVYERVGGFDPWYWMYWEDADICQRIAGRGYSTWFAPNAAARHATGASGRSTTSVRAFHRSAARYYDRYLSRRRASRWIAHLALDVRCCAALVAYARSRRATSAGAAIIARRTS